MKSSNRGNVAITFLIVLVLLIVGIGGFFAVSYISSHNFAANAESTIEFEYKNEQNVLTQYTNKMLEATQINRMYASDLKDIVAATFGGRYGEEGMKATWAWVKEQNPNLDPVMYQKLQQMIEAGRNEYRVHQTKRLDTVRQYQANLNYFLRGTMLRIAGYPKIDLEKYGKVITTESVQETYETGIDKPLQLIQ